MASRLAVLCVLASGTALAQEPFRRGGAPISPVDTWTVPTARTLAAQDKDKKSEQSNDVRTLEQKEKEDRAKYVRLPARSDVSAFPNDEQLERAILERLRQEEREYGRDPFAKYPPTLRFPVNPPIGGGVAYQPKTLTYSPMQVRYEPLYVVHRRLHFEEKNAERYGWELGIIQPLVSAAYFYKDVLLWPNSLASGVAYGFWDTNVGKCLPGSPTPYLLYPPGLTITGSVVEGLFVTGVAFAIP